MIKPLLVATGGFLHRLGKTALSIATFGYLGHNNEKPVGTFDSFHGADIIARQDDQDLLDLVTMLGACDDSVF